MTTVWKINTYWQWLRVLFRAGAMGVCSAGLLFFLLAAPCRGETRQLTLPLTVDYPLLRSLVVQSSFPGPDQTVVLLDQDRGCKRIVLSQPVFREEASLLRFEVKVFIRLGVTLFDKCISPLEWEGFLVMLQEPVITKDWKLSFVARSSSVYDKNRNPARIAGMIWEFANPPILSYLNSITVNLGMPVEDMRSFLFPLFPPDATERANRFLNSMRPGKAGVTPSALRIPILAEVEDIPEVESEPEILTDEERVRFVDIWEAWDAFLVQIMTAMAGKALSPYERGIFFDTLIEMRHRFVEDLDQDTGGQDVVRVEFVRAWTKLSPVFRAHLTDGRTRSLLGYLAFLAGADALVALDELGPGLGIEISRDGLFRLARLLMEDQPVSLVYGYEMDHVLRETLGLGPPPALSFPMQEEPQSELLRIPEEDPEGDSPQIPLKREHWEDWLSMLQRLLLSPAWAQEGEQQKAVEEIKRWLAPPKRELMPYIDRVRELLGVALKQVLAKEELHKVYWDFFERMVMVTAWQESCYRQFIVQKGTITYLRSYNGTSVGLMQINERVWRGIYEEKGLRWDIRYNAVAGCEILELYLRRYALRRMPAPEGQPGPPPDDILAQALYAMYNAGPSALNRFMQRVQSGSHTNMDRIILQKYQWAVSEDWEKILLCY